MLYQPTPEIDHTGSIRQHEYTPHIHSYTTTNNSRFYVHTFTSHPSTYQEPCPRAVSQNVHVLLAAIDHSLQLQRGELGLLYHLLRKLQVKPYLWWIHARQGTDEKRDTGGGEERERAREDKDTMEQDKAKLQSKRDTHLDSTIGSGCGKPILTVM